MFKKTFLLHHTALLECFIHSRISAILFTLPFKLFTAYPWEESNYKKNFVYLTDLQYSTFLLKKDSCLQHLSHSWDL